MKRRGLFIFLFLFVIPLLAQETNDMPQFFYTYYQATGNRVIDGMGSFPDVETYDAEFGVEGMAAQVPVWLVGKGGANPSWYVMSANNQSGVLSLHADTVQFDLLTTLVFSTRPPVIDANGRWIATIANDETLFSHPVPVKDSWLYISNNGDLVLNRDGTELDRLALNVLPDARIVISDDGRIAVYAGATNQRYVHGIMGDDLEGSKLMVLRVKDDVFEMVAQIDLEGDAVYEGLSPIWADVDGDGMQDLITTVSDGQVGSRIRVYLINDDGIREVNGQAIGQAHRWQHQLAWAAFGANGEMQLVDDLTPHIGGVVRFYQFTGDSLEIVATQSGYASHMLGSRNLDMAVAGDFNGDGQPEIVLPSQDHTRIAAIQNTANGARVIWELPLDGQLSSNLAAVQLEDGRLALAAGTDNGHLHVWVSR